MSDHTWESHDPLAFNCDGVLLCPTCTPDSEREADYTSAIYSDTPWYPGEAPPFACERCGTILPLTPDLDSGPVMDEKIKPLPQEECPNRFKPGGWHDWHFDGVTRHENDTTLDYHCSWCGKTHQIPAAP